MSKEFFLVSTLGGDTCAGVYQTHGAAVIKAQEMANKKPGNTYVIGHFKEAWKVEKPPVPPAAQLDLSQMEDDTQEVEVDFNPAPQPRARRGGVLADFANLAAAPPIRWFDDPPEPEEQA